MLCGIKGHHSEPEEEHYNYGDFMVFVDHLVTNLNLLQSFCDRNRGSKFFNHLMTVKEGIGCLGWVTVVSAGTLFNVHQLQLWTVHVCTPELLCGKVIRCVCVCVCVCVCAGPKASPLCEGDGRPSSLLWQPSHKGVQRQRRVRNDVIAIAHATL